MNVLVLNASALHAGFLGCYGNEWVDTPSLDRLAAGAVVFDQHYADIPGDDGAGRSCWTGRYRFPLPAAASAPLEKLPDLFRLLDEGGVSSSRIDVSTGEVQKRGKPPLARAVQQTLTALERLEKRDRWLLWIDFPSLAPPWKLPEEFLERYFNDEPDEDGEPLRPWLDPSLGPFVAEPRALERLQNTYAAMVSYFDDAVGSVLDKLEERSRTEGMLICLTASQGLNLSEHGVIGPGRPWLHEEVIHLPLLFRVPGKNLEARRISGLTQPVDLLPTLVKAFDLPVPTWAHGQSLWPLLRGERPEMRSYACSGMRVGETIEWALRTPSWGSILPVYFAADDAPRAAQLYVKPDDRWEVNNVRQHHMDLAEHLEQVLRDFVAASCLPGPLHSPELQAIESSRLPMQPIPSGE